MKFFKIPNQKRTFSVYFSMILLSAFCASLVIASHSSKMITLNPFECNDRVEAKFKIFSRTTFIPRSSEAFNSKTICFKFLYLKHLIKNLVKNRKFDQKSEVWSKIENFDQIIKVWLNIEISAGHFWSNFRFLVEISIIDQIFDSWPNFRFYTKFSIFDRNFDFWPNFQFLIEILIFDQIFNFLSKFRFLTQFL